MALPSFLDRITESAARQGQRSALLTHQGPASYGELFAVAQGIRKHVVQSGYAAPQRIGLVTGDDIETYAAILAAWALGAAYVPLNVHNPPGRNARIAADAELDLILTSRARESWDSHLPDPESLPPVFQTADIGSDPAPLTFPDSSPSDLAYIFFTSGSTGAPKGVPITHGNLSAYMSMLLGSGGYDFNHNDRFLQMFELTFDLSVASILTPWSVGACCCVVPEKGIVWMNILNLLARQEITIALMVPSVLPYIRRFFDEVRFPALRLSQFCGEALMQEMTVEWSLCVPNARIENVYGPTEATIWCTRYGWERETAARESVNGIVPIGKPVSGTQTFIIDENGHLCEPGERGELCLTGEQVMAGYWNDAEKTRESFVRLMLDGREEHAYRTGDVAYINEQGNLIYCGRKDSQVKIDGHRVELGEIEHFARQYIGSSSAAVVVARDSTGTDRLTLFVGGAEHDIRGLEQFLEANLPAYMRPRPIIQLTELPLNLNGKIDRPALARLAAEER